MPMLPIKPGAKVKTVKRMQEKSPYLDLPPCMLRDREDEVTSSELQAHSVAQSILSGALPASILPMFYKNPYSSTVGLGIGALLGGMLRLVSTAPADSRIKTITYWAQRSAAMNNPTKIANFSLPAFISIANTAGNALIEGSDNYAMIQGIFAGAHLGFMFAGVAISATNQIIATSTTPPSISSSL